MVAILCSHFCLRQPRPQHVERFLTQETINLCSDLYGFTYPFGQKTYGQGELLLLALSETKALSNGGMCRLIGENFFQDFIGGTGFLKKITDTFAQHTISEIVIEIATDADDLYLRIHFLELAKHSASPEAR